ncbi:MAG: IPT/TIG domain-containing protein [Jatrophihabitans endophyticus]|nr:IPT/TIG domain-containing protein [Jatrophihabitans endophyticus]
MDCRIVGFDCSGLTLYAWWPYEHLVHYAATQHRQAGRFHPTIGELTPGDLVFFSGYIADGIGHTAIYAGHGQVIEAPQSGERVTRARLVDVIADTGVYRGATRPMTHGRQAPGPQITSVTRTMKVSGGNIVVKGRNLGGVTSARVAGRTEYWFAHHSAHRLVLKAPAHHAGRVTVSVSNSWGTAHRTLTYVAPPKLTSLTPSSVSTAGGTTITLRGTGFTGITTAAVGTRRVRPHVLGATRATVAVPAHAAGTVTVTVASAYGVSDGLSLAYVAPAPSSARRAHTATPAPSSSASSGAGSSSAPPGTPTDTPVSSPSSGSPTPTTSTSPAAISTSPATPTG